MKIVGRSNFNDDSVSDILVAENIENEEFAMTLLQAINDNHSTGRSTYYFFLVKNDYKLYKRGEHD